MIGAQVVWQFATIYLIVTLAATSLAKLYKWRTASLALLRETIVPVRLAPIVIAGVALVELSLSTLIMLGAERVPVGLATASIFLLFGVYRIVVLARTKSLICTCAGVAEFNPATPPAVIATILTCLLQAGVAWTWMLLGSRYGTGDVELGEVAAWLAPFMALFIGSVIRKVRTAY
jgi:hypothetical protein